MATDSNGNMNEDTKLALADPNSLDAICKRLDKTEPTINGRPAGFTTEDFETSKKVAIDIIGHTPSTENYTKLAPHVRIIHWGFLSMQLSQILDRMDGHPAVAEFKDEIDREFRDDFYDYLKKSDELLGGTPGYLSLVQMLEDDEVEEGNNKKEDAEQVKIKKESKEDSEE